MASDRPSAAVVPIRVSDAAVFDRGALVVKSRARPVERGRGVLRCCRKRRVHLALTERFAGDHGASV
jgi:hypothetical protein